MKIDFVTTHNAANVHSWSGTPFHIAKALIDQKTELTYIDGLICKHRILLRLKSEYYRALGKRYLRDREFFVVRDYANQIMKRANPSSDVFFSPGSLPMAYLETNKPKVFYADATFAGLNGGYGSFTNLCAETMENGNKLEQAMLNSCSLAIYCSDWAAQTAFDNYSVDPAKVKVVPFGANIICERTYDDIKRMVASRSRTTCNLLFLGVEWNRKGGDRALEIVKALNDSGLKSQLHIAGIKSLPFKKIPENVINHGFISKATKEGNDKLDKLFADSHFLLLPTRAEAYGLVFCEANSYGVPDIATTVGGIPTIVKNNVNGMLFSLTSPAEEYAAYISELFHDYDRYKEMAVSSFREFQTRLNWNVAGKKIIELIKEL